MTLTDVTASRIYPVPIQQYPGSFADRWFVEVKTADGVWRDVSNCETELEALQLLSRVRLVDNSWTLIEEA